MTNAKLVQCFANGNTVPQVALEENISKRTLEKRVINLKNDGDCSTIAELVAFYYSKGLIKYIPPKQRK